MSGNAVLNGIPVEVRPAQAAPDGDRDGDGAIQAPLGGVSPAGAGPDLGAGVGAGVPAQPAG